MGNRWRWRWLLAAAILAVAVIFFWQIGVPQRLNVYEARARAVMGTAGQEGKQLLQELAEGRRVGVYHLQAEGDIAPAAGPEKIIGVSLTRDRGMLGVFRPVRGQPQLLCYLETLPLQELKVMELETGRNAVLIRELLDERFGAYFLSSFYALYTWQEEGLQEIWRKVAGNEERWNKRWLAGVESAGEAEGWQGISEQVKVDFTRAGGRLAITTISNQILWSAPAAEGPRTKIRERTVTHTYRWEPAWEAMVMTVGRVSVATGLKVRQGNKYVDQSQLAAGEEVAILEDEDMTAWVWGEGPAYWRVKSRNGQVGYVLKSCLDTGPGLL